MILVDTSIWVDHLRSGSAALANLLDHSVVLAHRCVIGELALGNMRDRDEVIGLMRGLPQALVAEHDEVLRLIDGEKLHGHASATSTPNSSPPPA